MHFSVETKWPTLAPHCFKGPSFPARVGMSIPHYKIISTTHSTCWKGRSFETMRANMSTKPEFGWLHRGQVIKLLIFERNSQ